MVDELVRFTGNTAGNSKGFAPVGLGTWAWGDRSTWGMGTYDQDLDEGSIAGAWEASLAGDVTLIDTAEVYGGGESERIIGRLLSKASAAERDRVVLASKFWPAPWRIRVKHDLIASLRASLDRLGVDRLDLYQIHGPISLRSASALAEALAEAVSQGLVQAVGVSNYSVAEMQRIHSALASHSIPLASNQVEFSLLRTSPLRSGLIAECNKLDVVVLAYSPLGQGRLTGKYSAENPPPGSRTFSNYPMGELVGLLSTMKRIGDSVGRTSSQVALRWIVQRGAVPIPGAKNAKQAATNAGALGWSLSEDQMAELDAAALPGRPTLRNRVWQHG